MNESEEEIAKRFDILSLFTKKARKKGEGETKLLDIPTLRSLLTATIFADRDTTSSTILYSFYNLAQYPE